MHVFLKNNPDKSRVDPKWNEGTLDFFEERRPNKKKKNKMISNVRS